MPFMPTPVRSWLCTRLAARLARTMARALEGVGESCRIEAGLARGAAAPDLPAAWPAHRRIALIATVEDIRRRHSLWIRLAGARCMVFALDAPILPRLRLWIGRSPRGGQPGGSAFVIFPPHPRS
jgi:hypothetical protein